MLSGPLPTKRSSWPRLGCYAGAMGCVTLVYMSTTITIRTDEALRRRLEEHAAERGKTLSEVAREILENGLTPRPIGERAGHLRGKLALPRRESEPWRQKLRERNWRR